MKVAYFDLLDILYVHQPESKDVVEYQYTVYQLITSSLILKLFRYVCNLLLILQMYYNV